MGLLIAVDSDGCVFDNMSAKHRQAFGPAFIEHYGLVDHAVQAQEVWDRINLFSGHRGVNRFKAVVLACDALRAAGFEAASSAGLAAWIKSGGALSAGALAEVASTNEDCVRALAWSVAVNERVGAMVQATPIPGAREALVQVRDRGAELVVVSQAARSTLAEEWGRCGLATLVNGIGGQEQGSKADQLRWAMQTYRPTCTIMIGDAPGDHQAAKEVGCLFYPIVPGDEPASWQRFADEALQRLVEQRFAGSYQAECLAAFAAALANP